MASLFLPPKDPKQEDEERDSPLKNSSFLSREEVLLRRSRRAKALYRRYRAQYWALTEEIRAKQREYYRDFAVSPLEEENQSEDGRKDEGSAGESKGEDDKIRVRARCGYGGCKYRAMPFTRFCHLHILADPKQTLYKGCIFVVRSSGKIGLCGKPILRAVMPSLCSAHFQKAQKNLACSLRKVGIDLCMSRRPTAEFNAIIVECVHNIQVERKKALTKNSEGLNSTADDMIIEKKKDN